MKRINYILSFILFTSIYISNAASSTTASTTMNLDGASSTTTTYTSMDLKNPAASITKAAKKKKKKKKKNKNITELKKFIAGLDLDKENFGNLKQTFERVQLLASTNHNLKHIQEQCAKLLEIDQTIKSLGITDEASLKHEITINTSSENISSNNTVQESGSKITFSPTSASSLAALLRLKELIIKMVISKKSITELSEDQIEILKQLSSHPDADTNYIGKHVYAMCLISKRNQLFGSLYGKIIVNFYFRKNMLPGTDRMLLMRNFKTKTMSSIFEDYFSKYNLSEFITKYFPDFYLTIKAIEELGKIAELNDMEAVASLKNKDLNAQECEAYSDKLHEACQTALNYSEVAQLRTEKLASYWAELSKKAKTEHGQYLSIADPIADTKQTISELFKNKTEQKTPTDADPCAPAPYLGKTKKQSIKPSSFTPKSVTEEQSRTDSSIGATASTADTNARINQSIQYASRVKQWFNSEFTSDKDPFSVLYHRFSPLADNIIMNHGIASKHNGDDHYSIGGVITYPDGKKTSGIFTLCFNDKGVCYHRGIETKTKQKIMIEYFKNGNWQIDQQSAVDDTSRSTDEEFITVGDPLSNITDNGVTVIINDNRNNVSIELIKLR